MNLYLLHGNHSFARKKAKENIVKNLSEETEQNITYFIVPFGVGQSNSIFPKIRQKLIGESLFAQKEMVVVDSLVPEKSVSVEFITPFLPRLSPNISLVLNIALELPKDSELLKTVRKLGGDVQLFKLSPAKDKSALLAEAKIFLARENVPLDSYLIQKLIDAGGGDWWYVFSALEQVVLLYHARVVKTPAYQSVRQNYASLQGDISELLDIQEEKSIFRLFDAIGRGEKARAFNILYENSARSDLKSGKEMETTLGFVTLMARHIRQMIAIKGGVSSEDAQKIWRVPIFVFSKLKYQASFFNSEFLGLAYEKLVDLQEKAKSGLYSPLSLVDFFVFYMISHRVLTGRP